MIGVLDDLSRGWIGDPVIHSGLLDGVLPGLRRQAVALKVTGGPLDDAQRAAMAERLARCSYVVKPGTPSWYRDYDEDCWRRLVERDGPHAAFLGVGTGIPEWTPPGDWHAHSGLLKDAVAPLLRSGLVDLVVCRDALCERLFRALYREAGVDPGDRVVRLPCPGFFSFPPRPRQEKVRVALDVADDRRCSRATDRTFREYYERLRYVRERLARLGAEVSAQTHERDLAYVREKSGFADCVQFASREDVVRYYDGVDVYVGAKVHGALPCAGSGAPALLLGVDGRQSAAWEVPDVKTVNVEGGDWHPEEVVAWWERLDARDASGRLLEFRRRALERWRRVVSERTPLGWACGEAEGGG